MSKRLARTGMLWPQVREARAYLAVLPDAMPKDTGDIDKDDAALESWISLDGLRTAWRALDTEVYKGKVTRIDLEKTAENPLAALMIFVSQGVYPPPELLAGLYAAWKEYTEGTKTLEQAFVGPSVQRVGPYWKRVKKSWTERNVIARYRSYQERGMSQEQSAQRALRAFPDCKLSVESLTRIARHQGRDAFEDMMALFQVAAARPPFKAADKKRPI